MFVRLVIFLCWELTAVVFALQYWGVEVFGHASVRCGGRQHCGVVPLSLLPGTRLVTQDIHQWSDTAEGRGEAFKIQWRVMAAAAWWGGWAQAQAHVLSAVSPGHVDFSVAGSASHLAEGNPDAHRHHQREGNHASDHVSSAAFRGKTVCRSLMPRTFLPSFKAVVPFPPNLNTLEWVC